MATRTVKARVELDGEKEYKQALSELNQGNKVLASELKKLQAEYKGNAESTEFLTKKGDLLQRQLQQQQDKVSKLREALQASAEKYGEADKRTQDWIIKLNNAEAAQYDLEHAIEENNNALTGQNDKMIGLGDTVDSVASKLGIKIPDGAKKALNGIDGLSAGTVVKMAAAAGAIAAVVKVVKELHDTTVQVAADVDQLLTDSMTTGLSTRTLQELEYAENLIDVSVNTITGSLTKLTKNMASANEENAAMAQSFANLGVSITNEVDGSLRPAEDVFYDIIDVLGQFDNETERDAVAMELFGKSAQELNPLIIQGSGALKEYAAEAQNLGYILNDEELAALGAVDDAYQRMQLTIDAAKKQIAADFAPASEAAMKLFSDAVTKAVEVLERSGMIENLAIIIQSLIDIIRSIGDIVASIPGFKSGIETATNALSGLAMVCAAIADVADIVAGLLTLDFSRVGTALGLGYGSGNANNVQRARMRQEGYLEQYDSFYGHNATGNDSWRGGLTWVGEAGPELVKLPQGSQIYNNQDSRSVGGVHIDTVVIDAKNVKDFNNVVRVFNDFRVVQRMGK
jgi:hypothetical protein